MLKTLNKQTISIMQSEEVARALKGLSVAANKMSSGINTTVVELGSIMKNVANPDVTKAMIALADQYRTLFGAYDFNPMSDATRSSLEHLQMASIAQLCLSHETQMIHDAIGCFANAKYEYLPDILNQAMQGAKIGAADMAFLKNGMIIPFIESELEYPRGLKTSIKVLNKSTAEDIADKKDIEYDTKRNLFISSEAEINSKNMNIVCAGNELLDDLFSEVELMNFVSYLSSTPSLGGFHETGTKLFQWIKEMYEHGTSIISFDHDIYYHCRSRQEGDMPYTYDEMLKALYGLPKSGRYNAVGRSHFYFADTRKGAETEVKKHLKEKEVLQTVMLKPKREIAAWSIFFENDSISSQRKQ